MGDLNYNGRHNMDESDNTRDTRDINIEPSTPADRQLLEIVDRVVGGKARSQAELRPEDARASGSEGAADDDASEAASLQALCVQLAASASEPGETFRAHLLARLLGQSHAQEQTRLPTSAGASGVQLPDDRPVSTSENFPPGVSIAQRSVPNAPIASMAGLSRGRSSRFTSAVFAIAGVAAMLVLLVGMWAMLKLRSDFASQTGQTPTPVSQPEIAGSATSVVPPNGVADALALVPSLQLLRSQMVGGMAVGADNRPLMAWSPDGARLASTGSNVVAAMDATSGMPLFISPFANGGTARSLSWSPDGRMIAVGLDYDEVVIMDSATGKELRRLASPAGEQRSDGPTPTPTMVGIAPPQAPIVSLSWSPDSKLLAAAPEFASGNPTERGGEVRVWDVTTGTLARNLSLADMGPDMQAAGVPYVTTRVAWSPDGRAVASISNRSVLVVWDPSTGARLGSLREGSFRWAGYRPLDFHWSPDGRTIAVLTQRSVEIWDPYGGKVLRSLPDPPPPWRAPGPVATSPPVAAPPTSTPTYVHAGERYGPLVGAAWSPQGDRIATFDGDERSSSFRVWEVATGRQLFSRRVGEGFISGMPLAWSPDGRVLTFKGDTLEFWDAQSNAKLRELEISTLRGFAWSPDGSLLAVYAGSAIEVWGDAAHAQASATAVGTRTPAGGPLPASTAQPINAAPRCGSWEIVQGADVNVENELMAVSALTDDEVWAVGYHNIGPRTFVDGTPVAPEQHVDRTLVVRWDGSSWKPVSSPNVGPGNNRLNSVVAIATDNAWAVGYYEEGREGQVRQRALILHWDGASWLQVPAPDLGPESSRLLDVAYVSADEVWAVGHTGGDDEPGEVFPTPTKALALRWDGSNWSQVDMPSPGQYRNEVYGVSALRKDHIWAVGRYSSQAPRQMGGGVPADALILFWDGGKWEQFAAPPVGNSFTGVSAIAEDAAWIVGSAGTEGSNRSAMLRWDGNTWSAQDLPVPTPSGEVPPSDYLPRVVALSPTDVWAVGSYEPDLVRYERVNPLSMHWNGSEWSHVPMPSHDSEVREINGLTTKTDVHTLNAVAGTPSGDLWAVGSYRSAQPGSEMLIMRYRRSECPTPASATETARPTAAAPLPPGVTVTPSAVGAPPSPPAGGCGPAWSSASTYAQGTLEGVAVGLGNEVWAVGASRNSPPDTLTMRWDGGRWDVVPSPNVGHFANALRGVAKVGAEVWAVGSYNTDDAGNSEPLALRWDGNAWRIADTHRVGAGRAHLSAVAALAPDDVWAVGGHVADVATGKSEPLALHWDGRTWARVPIDAPGLGSATLSAVTALSGRSIWAVGSYGEGQSSGPASRSKTLALRWDGAAWHHVPSPNVDGMDNYLLAVEAVDEDDVWAVGGQNSGEHLDTLTLHWDGRDWRIVPSPKTSSHNGATLSGLAAIASNDVWAVGHDNGFALIERWNGLEWTGVVPGPEYKGPLAYADLKLLTDIVELPDRGMIAVGGQGLGAGSGGVDTPTVLRYAAVPCGTSTVPAETLGPGGQEAALTGTALAMPTSRSLPTATSSLR